MTYDALTIRAGRRAAQRLRDGGLSPVDIGGVAAAAGGPKGLALVALDRLLFGDWLAAAPRLELVGASVGAWRMACAAQADPACAAQRFAEAYIDQRYSPRPTQREVTASIRGLAAQVLGPRPWLPRANVALNLVTARGDGALRGHAGRAAFARAALANARARVALAAHLRRVVFQCGQPQLGEAPFDAFGCDRVALTADNVEDALAASGSIPLLCEAVRDPRGAPAGDYWDGGLIDYHPVWPYARLPGIVLFPHFVPHLTRGWLDKYLPWRRHARGESWLDNVLLIAPSPALVRRLPGRKLPDRGDFMRYRDDVGARIRTWRAALAETERFAEQAMQWLQRPHAPMIAAL